MNTYPEPILIALNYLERIFWTFVQTFIVFALAQSTLDVTTAQAAAMAGAAGALTAILGLITDWTIPADLPFGVLSMLRVLRTFAVSTLTVLLSSAALDLSAGSWKLAAVASLPAVLAAVKAVAAERLGAETPATLPARADLLAGADAFVLGA